MIRILRPVPLSEAAFAPFGHVFARPERGNITVGPAENLRPGVGPRLSWSRPKLSALPLDVVTMERHEFSSQSFLPMGEVRWLILVAPHGETGPEMAGAVAFLADGAQAITYRPDTWHHPITALTPDAAFAVLTFLDGSRSDEEFVPVAPGLAVAL
jgi:ureidoglycolate lyase